MEDYIIKAGVAKAGLLGYCKKICRGLWRPEQRLVTDVMYGIAAGNSCRLTEIGRALAEDIPLKKTVNRLSMGLMEFSEGAVLWKNHLKMVDKYIDDTTIFAIDESDAAKPYSVAMEGLRGVHDGSTGKIVPGYMTLEIAALTHKTKTPISVYERVFSAAEPGFVSQPKEVLDGLRFLSSRYGHGGFRVIDRGGDSNAYMEYFIQEKEKFIIRVKENRVVMHKGKPVNIMDLAGWYKGKYAFRCTLSGKKHDLKVAEIPIKINDLGEHQLYLIVVYGFGEKPMLLLTNCHGDALCTAVVKIYLLRWKIEEHFRFKKTQYNFEDFRVRKLCAIRALHLLCTLLAAHLALLTQDPDALLFRLLRHAARAIPRSKNRKPKKLFHYELAAGLAFLLSKTTANLKRLFPPKQPLSHASQLSLLSAYQLRVLSA